MVCWEKKQVKECHMVSQIYRPMEIIQQIKTRKHIHPNFGPWLHLLPVTTHGKLVKKGKSVKDAWSPGSYCLVTNPDSVLKSRAIISAIEVHLVKATVFPEIHIDVRVGP